MTELINSVNLHTHHAEPKKELLYSRRFSVPSIRIKPYISYRSTSFDEKVNNSDHDFFNSSRNILTKKQNNSDQPNLYDKLILSSKSKGNISPSLFDSIQFPSLNRTKHMATYISNQSYPTIPNHINKNINKMFLKPNFDHCNKILLASLEKSLKNLDTLIDNFESSESYNYQGKDNSKLKRNIERNQNVKPDSRQDLTLKHSCPLPENCHIVKNNDEILNELYAIAKPNEIKVILKNECGLINQDKIKLYRISQHHNLSIELRMEMPSTICYPIHIMVHKLNQSPTIAQSNPSHSAKINTQEYSTLVWDQSKPFHMESVESHLENTKKEDISLLQSQKFDCDLHMDPSPYANNPEKIVSDDKIDSKIKIFDIKLVIKDCQPKLHNGLYHISLNGTHDADELKTEPFEIATIAEEGEDANSGNELNFKKMEPQTLKYESSRAQTAILTVNLLKSIKPPPMFTLFKNGIRMDHFLFNDYNGAKAKYHLEPRINGLSMIVIKPQENIYAPEYYKQFHGIYLCLAQTLTGKCALAFFEMKEPDSQNTDDGYVLEVSSLLTNQITNMNTSPNFRVSPYGSQEYEKYAFSDNTDDETTPPFPPDRSVKAIHESVCTRLYVIADGPPLSLREALNTEMPISTPDFDGANTGIIGGQNNDYDGKNNTEIISESNHTNSPKISLLDRFPPFPPLTGNGIDVTKEESQTKLDKNFKRNYFYYTTSGVKHVPQNHLKDKPLYYESKENDKIMLTSAASLGHTFDETVPISDQVIVHNDTSLLSPKNHSIASISQSYNTISEDNKDIANPIQNSNESIIQNSYTNNPETIDSKDYINTTVQKPNAVTDQFGNNDQAYEIEDFFRARKKDALNIIYTSFAANEPSYHESNPSVIDDGVTTNSTSSKTSSPKNYGKRHDSSSLPHNDFENYPNNGKEDLKTTTTQSNLEATTIIQARIRRNSFSPSVAANYSPTSQEGTNKTRYIRRSPLLYPNAKNNQNGSNNGNFNNGGHCEKVSSPLNTLVDEERNNPISAKFNSAKAMFEQLSAGIKDTHDDRVSQHSTNHHQLNNGHSHYTLAGTKMNNSSSYSSTFSDDLSFQENSDNTSSNLDIRVKKETNKTNKLLHTKADHESVKWKKPVKIPTPNTTCNDYSNVKTNEKPHSLNGSSSSSPFVFTDWNQRKNDSKFQQTLLKSTKSSSPLPSQEKCQLVYHENIHELVENNHNKSFESMMIPKKAITKIMSNHNELDGDINNNYILPTIDSNIALKQNTLGSKTGIAQNIGHKGKVQRCKIIVYNQNI